MHKLIKTGHKVRSMTIIRTDQWLKQALDKPLELLQKVKPTVENPTRFYRYLCSFGMYQHPRRAQRVFQILEEKEAWKKINKMYQKYRSLWDGPTINIYIFPMEEGNRSFMRDTRGRSGITFPKQIFLFLSSVGDEKEWEALFVHEYHHATRMSRLKKEINDYTLLDSLVLEGLAEHAVLDCCGGDYVAPWCTSYQEKRLASLWQRAIKQYLHITRSEARHDDILFGKRAYPRMIGYVIGYHIIAHYKKQASDFSIAKTLGVPSNTFLQDDFLKLV